MSRASGDENLIASFGRLLWWVIGLSLGVMVLGSLVRATDSGLACPDWPLCYDQAIPAFDWQIFLEWFHRVLAGALGIVFLIVAAQLIRKPILSRLFAKQIFLAGVLFVVQVVLGGLTVLQLLEPKIVSLHLINAVAFLTILLWMAQGAAKHANRIGKIYAPSWWRQGLIVFSIVLFAQILWGGMVSTNKAGLACPDFPTCFGMWMPPASYIIWLQYGHRLVAFALLGGALWLALTLGKCRFSSAEAVLISLLPILMFVQIGLGIVNVFYALPVWASVSHLGNALLIFTIAANQSIRLSMATPVAANIEMDELSSLRPLEVQS